MPTPFAPFMEGKKLVYATRNVRVVDASVEWPNQSGMEGVQIMHCEHYVHGEWFPIRTSKLVSINGNDHETLNSIYRVVE